MTIPYQNYDGDQQTSYDKALKDLQKTIAADERAGDTSEKFVFLVADGVGDSRKPTSCTKRLNGSRCIEPIDTKACEKIKKDGHKIAVLYTTYLPLPSNGFYRNWVAPFQGEIAKKMQECATPGLYAEVGMDGSIPDAMKALFNTATTMPRLIY